MRDILNVQRNYITNILQQREEFLIIGLTGRIGSGCSTVAQILGQYFSKLGVPSISPNDSGFDNDKQRDLRILYRYAYNHWLKFDIIKVRSIITSFLVGDFDKICKDYFIPITGKEDIIDIILNNVKATLAKENPSNWLTPNEIGMLNKILQNYSCNKIEDIKDTKKYIEAIVKRFDKLEESTQNDDYIFIVNLFKQLYRISDLPENYQKRQEYLRIIDSALNKLSSAVAYNWWNNNCREKDFLNIINSILTNWNKEDSLDFLKYIVVNNIIPCISDSIHKELIKNSHTDYTQLYQKFGNSIRRYGKIRLIGENSTDNIEKREEDGNTLLKIDKEDYVYFIPRRINQFIKSLRHPFSRTFAKPTRIVIDSIKSSLEAEYLRERYSAFYLIAVSCDEHVRRERLLQKNITSKEINFMDWNEYSNLGAAIYERCDKGQSRNANEMEFYDKVINVGTNKKDSLLYDNVRKDAYFNNTYQFILQNVASSIENADIFISNNYTDKNNRSLRWEIIRNICLIYYPGLLLPTPIERCMQAAFVAKANSGCLSRQVGAVVTDSDYNILSIGWNDVPFGDISCARKNLMDIQQSLDSKAYSKYENTNLIFRERINEAYKESLKVSKDIGAIFVGLPWRYCFKDIHSDIKQPMRSRAMHAEEKALSNVSEKAYGGCLFTTSSPCEMCSKNAKNHKIKKIYYIEYYPGISEDQYSNSGDESNRAEHILFTGAIGRAYTQMYTPIMPHKDIIKYMLSGVPRR